jgi:hypothetical protein
MSLLETGELDGKEQTENVDSLQGRSRASPPPLVSVQ